MVAVVQQGFSFFEEMVHEFGNASDHTDRTEGGLEEVVSTYKEYIEAKYAPSSVCMCCCYRAIFQSRCTGLATSPQRKCWRRCRAQGPPRTCWSDSYRYVTSSTIIDNKRISTAHFFSELVTSINTSWFSSSSNMMPKYPSRLSLNLGLATSLRHSIWPKCAGYPSM